MRGLLKGEWCLKQGDWNPVGADRKPQSWVADGEFETKLPALCTRITEHLKQRAVYTKIADCRQEEGEEVRKYLERLKEVFEAHSGIDKPNPPDHAGPFEQQLKNAFLQVMNGQ